MPLSCLPTELDWNIVQRLDRKGLNAMSKISKYYRDLVEPFLYMNLTFGADHHVRITTLFLTIIERPSLAEYIRSFTLTRQTSPPPSRGVTNTYYLRFWKSITAVRELIEDVGDGLNKELVLHWFGHIYVGKPSFDGALAVILCLATNLKHLNLETRIDELSITTKLLGWRWRRKGKGLAIFPFYHLKTLLMRGAIHEMVPVLPYMEALCMIGDLTSRIGGFSPVYFPYPRSGMSTNLRVFEMKVDVQLLTTYDVNAPPPYGKVLYLTRHEEYLPDSLEVLHFHHLCGARDERAEVALEAAHAIVLRTVELSLELADWDGIYFNPGVVELPKTRRRFFRDAVAKLDALGVTVRVLRQESRFPEELLFAPGYQRKWPIWGDIGTEYWKKRVRTAWMAREGVQRASDLSATRYQEWNDQEHDGVDEDGSIDEADSDNEDQAKDRDQDYDKSKGHDGDDGANSVEGNDRDGTNPMFGVARN